MTVNLRKPRYRNFYKIFAALRVNIQNRRRLNLFKFKKKKWTKLILLLKRLQARRKKNYRMYDTNRYYLPKFYNSFKKKYRYTLHTKKKFKLFYGYLLERTIRKKLDSFLKQKPQLLNKSKKLDSFFIKLWEERLDMILYRAHFAPTVRAARQLILHKHIRVNNTITKDCSLVIKKADIIQISSKVRHVINSNIKSSSLWPLPPKYLQINYKILQIHAIENLVNENFSVYFPFRLDIHALVRYYK